MIKVMVADDNTELNYMCCKFLTNDENIKVISSTTDGKTTLEEYLRLKPDVLLLDLDLPMINGLEIIDALCSDSEEKEKCNIIIISGSINYRANLFNTSKVYRIIPKPLNFPLILSTIKELNASENTISQKYLKELLLQLKFNLYTDGTNYFMDAVNLAYQKPFLLRNIKDIYSEVSIQNEVDYGKVRWGIRNSVRTMNKYINPTIVLSIFPWYDTERNLTPRYLLTLIVEYFEHEV